MASARVGTVVEVVLPYSEVCMFMRVAGERRRVAVHAGGVQIMRADGVTPDGAPVTHGEAGVRVVG